MTISISGPLRPYEFDYIIDNTTGYIINNIGRYFRIKIRPQSNLIGGNQETISVVVHDSKIITDLDGNGLRTNTMQEIIPFYVFVVSDEEKQEAQSQSSFSIVSLVMTFGTSYLIQLTLGSAVEATWLLLGNLQLMSLLPLISVNLPSNFREFSKNLAVLNGEPEAIPNIFEYYYDSINVGKEPYNRYYNQMNFKTSYFLLNSGRKVEIWTAIMIVSCLTWLLLDF